MSWLHRNIDIVAVTVIAVVIGIGSNAAKVAEKPWVIHGAAPVVREVKPRLMDIRNDVHEEIRRQSTEIQAETLCDMRHIRSKLRSAGVHMRQELREMFR